MEDEQLRANLSSAIAAGLSGLQPGAEVRIIDVVFLNASSAGARRLAVEEPPRRLSGRVAVIFEVLLPPTSNVTVATLAQAGTQLQTAMTSSFQAASLPWVVGPIDVYDPVATSTSTTSTTATLTTSTSTTATSVTSTTTTTSSTTTTVTPFDCTWDDWLDWSSCTLPCGGGSHTRYRTILARELNGGLPCSGLAVGTGTCNTKACRQCPTGFYLDLAVTPLDCVPCAAGRFNPNVGELSSAACAQCPNGTVSSPGATACTPCRAGTAVMQMISTDVAAIEAGALAGFARAGRHVEASGTVGSLHFLIECSSTDSNFLTVDFMTQGSLPALFGVYIDGNPSTAWNVSTTGGWQWSGYSPDFHVTAGQHALVLHTDGNDMKLRALRLRGQCGFIHAGELFCGKCSPGSYSGTERSTACSPCGRGHYSTNHGVSACMSCKNGTYNPVLGAEDSSFCLDCPLGRVGTTPAASSIDSCAPCGNGTYADITGSTACSLCDRGTAVNEEGSSACPLCSPGSFSPDLGRETCTDCSPGTFLSFAGATDPAYCTRCLPGTFRSEEGGSACSNCVRGSYSMLFGAVTCTSCPAGRFGAVYGSVSLALCGYCAPGKYASAGAFTCTPCSAGTYSGQGAGGCALCPGGSFAAGPGASACDSCPRGSYREADDPGHTCTPCERGRYNPDLGAANSSDCLACPAGTFGPGTGAFSLSACLSCRGGNYSGPGASSCATCRAGTYSLDSAPGCSPCQAGRFVGFPGASGCEDCRPGTFREGNASGVSCVPCAAGTFSLEAAAASPGTCAGCSKGRYSPAAGSTQCLACGAGSHSAQQGLTECAPCSQESGTPAGAAACCPHNDLEAWPVSPAGSLYAPPGISESRIHHLDECSSGPIEGLADTVDIGSTLTDVTRRGLVNLATVQGRTPHDLLCLTCGSPGCRVQIHSDREIFTPGDALTMEALVHVSNGSSYAWTTCDQRSSVMLVGFGCAPDTLSYFLLALTGVVVLTIMLGISVEVISRSRLVHLLECSLDIFIPRGALPAMPTKAMLRSSVVSQLKVPQDRMQQFHAWLTRDPSGAGAAHVLHVDFAVRAKGRDIEALRRRLLRSAWAPAEGLSETAGLRVEQQPPALVRGRGQAPGLELFALFERAALILLGRSEAEEARDQKYLHLDVAREVLRRLTSRKARVLLVLQYILNIAAAAGLPALGFQLMTRCEAGFPGQVHIAWLSYVAVSSSLSILLLRCCLAGPRAREFCWCFRTRLFVRMAFACIMLTDMYQDATFTVIAKRCGFGLWFVSAWLIVLGMGVMQILMQILTLSYCALQYRRATTPERRESLLVEMAFLALRGSDNLTLVYAVRPAVEEQLGGASSWAMKMSEARIAFFRFIFEDVEQSALQVVFVIFYEDAALADKVWVSLSIATSLLLSFTLVVQCLPEVRDWLWYRVFSRFPGGRRIPWLRLVWIILMVALYRALSIFPWVSACSPSGDPCAGRGFPWGCKDGALTLLWLPARMEVVSEVLLTSSFCFAGLVASVLLSGLIWWRRRRRQHWGSRVRSVSHYSADGRFGSAAHALRPKADEDDDPWLTPAREVHRSATAAGGHGCANLAKLVEALDEILFKLSQREGKAAHAELKKKRLDARLADLKGAAIVAHLGNEVWRNTEHLCNEALHTVQLAEVRESVRRLLSKRRFIRADVVEKASLIEKATGGAAPLRFLHWTALEALGALPKCRGGAGKSAADAAAVGVDELLGIVSSRLSVSASQAKRHLVTFFLSHRWLRARGPRHEHHPDSHDNVKASRLVAFAKWFIKLAEKTGLRCDVAFWVDWSCCDQEEPHRTALGIAALPLYIAACTKILSWRTNDFERRCWTMVERLLSYSFCTGGLTPYVIDETFGMAEDDDDEFELLGGSDEDSTPATRASRSASGTESESDGGDAPRSRPRPGAKTEELRQSLGDCMPVEPEDEDRPDSGPDAGPSKVSKWRRSQTMGVRLARGSSFALRSIRSVRGGRGGKSVLHRRSRKLPNPLDPQTCQLTRHADRREITVLVETALSVPALEVFADRQPVEWGITEIIEQSLASRSDLPHRWEPEEEMPRPATWLQLEEGGAKGGQWQLVVKNAGDLQAGGARDDVDAIVWIDHGGPPPPGGADEPPPHPEEIDRLFRSVDQALSKGDAVAAAEGEIRALLLALKADLQAALDAGDQDGLEAAVLRARDVELPQKHEAVEKVCGMRLASALESGDEAVMRGALQLARFHGVEHLEGVAAVRAEQQRLYDLQLDRRLRALLASDDIDPSTLGAVCHTAAKHGLESLREQALATAQRMVSSLSEGGTVEGLLEVRRFAEEGRWHELLTAVDAAIEELTMLRAAEAAAAKDDLAALRAVEQRAQSLGYKKAEQRAQACLREAAGRVGERMGLPAEWDVVLELAGTDARKMLKKSEDTEKALVERMQQLLDFTFTGWGGYGKRTRTRDRGKERVASKLKVMSVIRVQNAESYVNYRAKRKKTAERMKDVKDLPIGEYWDVKTSRISFVGAGGIEANPVDPMLNEHYLFHGTDPNAAEGITDRYFDMKRAGTKYGALFGPGIYLAESCMKADEYTAPDKRGWFPLLLCRTILGRINYCDDREPSKLGRVLEASCRPGGRFDSVLGDREKVVKTFREFIVFDSHQVYPEFIVWYSRVYD